MKDLIKDWGTRDRSGGLVGGFGVAVTFQNNPRKIQCVTIASMSTLPPGFAIRTATLDDVKTIVGHRRAMFRDMRSPDEATLDSMAARFGPWLRRKMQSREYLAWLAVTGEGEVAAGAGLWLMDWPPHVLGSGPRRGNILNVYTEWALRRRGLARALMEAALTWCRENQVDLVVLHASPDGRALYESLGFEASNEMRVRI